MPWSPQPTNISLYLLLVHDCLHNDSACLKVGECRSIGRITFYWLLVHFLCEKLLEQHVILREDISPVPPSPLQIRKPCRFQRCLLSCVWCSRGVLWTIAYVSYSYSFPVLIRVRITQAKICHISLILDEQNHSSFRRGKSIANNNLRRLDFRIVVLNC